MIYPSIRIEGAILSPDIFDRLDDISGQRPSDFGFDSSVKVKDEIARAWADAQDYWRIFQRKLELFKADSPATTETRNLWIVPLLGLLGYQLEYQARGMELNGKNYSISHRVTNRGQTALHIIGYRETAGLDRKPERTTVRMSAHALVQEYLNLSDQVYGLVTNGRLLRLLRDSSRLVKLTYLEFDLDRIFTDGLFADFAVLYRLLHVSRLPVSPEITDQSLIERYHVDSLESGARIRDGLSRAVEQAILSFGNGFLTHPGNESLRQAVSSGELKADAYYHSLLRLIYRLLFLLVIEERDLVYPSSAPTAKREVYDQYYSLQRLRRLSEKRYLADHRHNDLWLSLLATFRLFEADGPGSKLGLAPLAGDLFGPDAIGSLNRCMLTNEVLLCCLRSLGLYQHPETGQVIRVNYAALNVEEFGSVYEGLLEYEPVFHSTGNQLEFAFAKGDERAATGSHYTPDELVQPLLKHSLDYLIADKLKESNKEKALLSLRVADIACGSGHILLAAARRIATDLAIVRTGEEQPSPGAFRAAVRDVIRECIYGVDYNPLAVELCKVAFWLEAHNPGQPLNFLDHHIKNGNAIVGYVRREELDRGVPDEAFATMPEDDKEVAAEFRKQNKAERKAQDQTPLNLAPEIQKQLEVILQRWQEVSGLPEQTPAEIDAKKRRYQDFTKSQDAWILNQIACIPIAQFYLPKTQTNHSKLITDAEFRLYWSGQRHPQGQATAAAWAKSAEKRFFHWFLEFPEIMERGGWDCILGNPPFLGGQKLSGTYGHEFLNWLKAYYQIVGSCDLVTYFFRRIFDLIRPRGFMSLIATNSVSQGVAREGGLEVILRSGGVIVFAVPSQKWPGRAAVEVSLISVHKGEWKHPAFLRHAQVRTISSYLDDAIADTAPAKLLSNVDKCFMGSTVVGAGFILDPPEAKNLLAENQYHRDLVLPYLNGSDLNSDPAQQATRYIINFGEMPLRRADIHHWNSMTDELRLASKKSGIAEPNYREPVACDFPRLIDLVEKRVRPSREEDKLSERSVTKWWQFYRPTTDLYGTIGKLSRVLVTAQTSKTTAFAFVDRKQVFDAKLIVFAFDDFASFAILQSCFHVSWAWKYCTTMKADLSYGPERLFLTYPFPNTYQESETLSPTGERYHEIRRQLMLKLNIGLTKFYNLLHKASLSVTDVVNASKQSFADAETALSDLLQFRRLLATMDHAVLEAYGWNASGALGPAISLSHDFYEVDYLPENDRVRYTISPTARKEVLRRLLALNHERAKAEQAVLLAAMPVTSVKRTRKVKNDVSSGNLFG